MCALDTGIRLHAGSEEGAGGCNVFIRDVRYNFYEITQRLALNYTRCKRLPIPPLTTNETRLAELLLAQIFGVSRAPGVATDV